MTKQTTIPPRQRVVFHERPQHLRSLSHPVSRQDALQMFARQQVAEAFQRLCA